MLKACRSLLLVYSLDRHFTNEPVGCVDLDERNPGKLCHFLFKLGKRDGIKETSEGRIVCTKVVLLRWVCGWCHPVPATAAFTVHCAGLPGKQLQPRTWPRLFTVPPSVKRVMLSVLNGQRFSLCARSKQRAKLVSKLHSFCILVLQASFVWSLAQCFTPLLTWLECWR